MADGVKKTFYRELIDALTLLFAVDSNNINKEVVIQILPKKLIVDGGIKIINAEMLEWMFEEQKLTKKLAELAIDKALQATERKTYQAMEAFLHNLNTMHSRAGAQVPFSSINYGTDNSIEGQMVVEQLLLATEAGLGNGETAIFPIQVFKVKEGINLNPCDTNYHLFKLACKVSAKRLFPNFSFLDAPFNLQYYKEGRPETEVATMGCRTRVIGSIFPESDGNVNGRGNLSFTTINLPRIGFEVYKKWEQGLIDKNKLLESFKEILNDRLNLVVDQLVERFVFQSRKTSKNFPSLIGQGIWFGSEKLGKGEPIGEILRHGTLSIGFIGLAEALILLTGSHHGESVYAQSVGLNIIQHMRDFCDQKSQQLQLNVTLLATPAEGLSGRFTKLDRKIYGEVKNVTDKEYYTNSFHVPVYHKTSIFEKLKSEAPYHALCNAGHISYVELDGAAKNNPEAFEVVIRNMAKLGIGYGSINHPVDRDLLCGYTGIIGDTCPSCKRDTTNGKDVERIRRITGYLVGSMDNWNNAKRAEERDRVKHI
jgi:ribonucleoside-triphosphate reductase